MTGALHEAAAAGRTLTQPRVRTFHAGLSMYRAKHDQKANEQSTFLEPASGRVRRQANSARPAGAVTTCRRRRESASMSVVQRGYWLRPASTTMSNHPHSTPDRTGPDGTGAGGIDTGR